MINSKRQEFLQRGTPFFPIQYYFCGLSEPVHVLPMHWHMEYEIIHILKGSGNFYLGRSNEDLKEGNICFIMSGNLHGGGNPSADCIYESVVFDINMLRAHNYIPDVFISDIINENICINDVISSGNDEISDIVIPCFEMMKSKSEGYELSVCGYLMQLFGAIKRNKLYSKMFSIEQEHNIRSSHIKNVFKFIEENYAHQIMLEQLAGTAGLSPKYFCRVFHDLTHKTPVEYLNRFRINRACIKIMETNESLSEIAASCGFNDFSYFIKTFKRYKGTTPYKYRRFISISAEKN